MENLSFESISSWTINEKCLEKTFQFKDFLSAISFINEVSKACEQMNHHPEWTNVYNQVLVKLSTHDANKITDLDIKLAQIMDQCHD